MNWLQKKSRLVGHEPAGNHAKAVSAERRDASKGTKDARRRNAVQDGKTTASFHEVILLYAPQTLFKNHV